MTITPTNLDIVVKIKEALKDRFDLDISAVTENSRLKDLGVDSLHVVEIMLDLEAALGIKLEDISFPPNPTLTEVAAAVARNLPSHAQ
jgi:acyl carrier protein